MIKIDRLRIYRKKERKKERKKVLGRVVFGVSCPVSERARINSEDSPTFIRKQLLPVCFHLPFFGLSACLENVNEKRTPGPRCPSIYMGRVVPCRKDSEPVSSDNLGTFRHIRRHFLKEQKQRTESRLIVIFILFMRNVSCRVACHLEDKDVSQLCLQVNTPHLFAWSR